MVTEVYIIKESVEEETDLKKLFVSPIFNVNEVVVPKPIGFTATKNMSLEDIYEAYQFQWCLSKAKNKLSKIQGALILKSSSITNASPDFIARFVNELNNSNDSFDLFYLCRWEDECQKITDIKEFHQLDVKVGKTYYPSGLQAIYFSPVGIDIFLGMIPMKNGHIFNIDYPLNTKLRYEILEGNICSWCVIGNIFNFDLTKAQSNQEYQKTHECVSKDPYCPKDKKDKNSAFYNYLWVIIILIIIIIVVIVLLSSRK